MKILDFISKEELQELQELFSDATGLSAVILGDEGRSITEKSAAPDFCERCSKGNTAARERCEKNEAEINGCSYCHAGLMEFGEDITVEGNVVGRVVGGKVFTNTPDETKIRALASEYGINPDEYWSAACRVPVKNEKAVKAGARLFGLIVNRIVEGAYFGKTNSLILDVIKPEIEKSTESVNDITNRAKKLEEIASRQNILTLNASIEAARAGAAGAGFAVVAHQMGEMSKNSGIIYSDIEKDANDLKEYINTINGVFTGNSK